MSLTVLFIFDSLPGAFSIFLKVLYLRLSCVYHTTGGITPQARTHFPRLFHVFQVDGHPVICM